MKRFFKFSVIIFILSCNRHGTNNKEIKSDSLIKKSIAFLDTGGRKIRSFTNNDSDKYIDQLIDSGLKENSDQYISFFESKINLVCDSAIQFLQSYKDTVIVYGLLKSFKNEKDLFQSQLRDESEIIFMSYGKLSTAKEERKAAADGYYYLALKNRYYFLQGAYQNVKESFEY